ncbi:MAG: hypothetical protein JJ958_11845 [Balneola sp.]|nr:hypothetical protein [Balneola sp.]
MSAFFLFTQNKTFPKIIGTGYKKNDVAKAIVNTFIDPGASNINAP